MSKKDLNDELKNNIDKEKEIVENIDDKVEDNISTEDIVKNISDLKKQSEFDYKSKYEEKLEKDAEVQKCIKEMHKMEEENEKKNNFIMIGTIGVVSVIVLCLAVKMISTPLSSIKNKKNSQVASQNNTTNVTVPQQKQEKTLEQELGVANSKIYTTALGEEIRKNAINQSIKINENSPNGITAIYIAELLRSAGIPVPATSKNTKDLVDSLTALGWKPYTDPKQLKKGDVCFTTEMSDMAGHPSHVYIFMGWVKEGNTDTAFVCDSLIAENNNEWIHKRNIDFETENKQKMAFFMRAE